MTTAKTWWRALPATFAHDRRGAVALIFGLVLLPLLAAIGLAIDFGNVMTMRTKAQMAADAAALQAAGVARDLIKDGGAADASALADAKTRATALFKAHAQQAGLKDYVIDVTVTKTGRDLASKASFTVRSVNFVSKVFGYQTFVASGAAVSSASLPAFTDVYLALDISQSMGIASTQDGMNKLYSAVGYTKPKTGNEPRPQTARTLECVFGCHVVEDYDSNNTWTESFSGVAKRVGVQLRIDVLREAVKEMISTASKDAGNSAIYKIGIYTMGMASNYTTSKLIELSAPSGSFPTLQLIANGIDLGPAPGNGYSDSYINENLKDFAKLVPKSEDGSATDKTKKFAFIITDGVRDIQSSSACVKTGNRCVSEVSADSCAEMKKNGITVGVLYTTYVPIRPIKPPASSDWYQLQVVNTGVSTKIQPALKACASDGWFYEASDADGIHAAMAKMFAQTTLAPALTN